MRVVAHAVVGSAALALSLHVPVAAQSRTSPPGAVRGLFGGETAPGSVRTTQQLSTWFDFGVGIDDRVGNESTGLPEGDGLRRNVDQTAVGSLRYWIGRTTRSVETQARVYRTTSQAIDTAVGGELNLIGNLGLGGRSGTTVNVRAADESARLFTVLGAGPGVPAPPTGDEVIVADVSPPQGVVENRWVTLAGGLNAFHRWHPRQRTSVQYVQMVMRPRRGQAFDSDMQGVSVQHDWTRSPAIGLMATYRFDRLNQSFTTDPADVQPFRTQSAELGVRWERRLSPTRRIAIGLTGGATQILTGSTLLAEIEGDVEPRFGATASYTLARQWFVTGSVSRGVTALAGVSQEAFDNESATASLTGIIARRLTVTLAGAWSRGGALGPASGSFVASNATATAQWGFRYGGLFAGISRYTHELRSLAGGPGLIPLIVDRYSVRGGVTVWLPLYGAF